MTQEQMEGLKRLQQMLAEGHPEMTEFLGDQHPADLAEWLEELTEDQRNAVFRMMHPEDAAPVLGEMELETQADVITALGAEKASDIIEEMDVDEAADLLGELTPEEQGQILSELDIEDAADVRELLEHDPETAGGIMTNDYISVHAGMTAQEAIEHLRAVAPEAESFFYVYVIDLDDRLLGVLSLRELIIAQPDTPVSAIAQVKIVSVFVDQDQEVVAELVRKYNLLAIPVTDRNRRLLGIITVDDIIDVMQEEETEDALRMAAVTPDDEDPGATDFKATIWKLARPRLPWLVALLFMEIISGKVVDTFQHGFPPGTLTMLTIFITTMAGEAGNAATQALAVVVRSMALGEISSVDALRVVWRELRVGVTVGLVCAIALAAIAFAWRQNLQLSLVVGLAIFINIPIAKVIGGVFPILIERLGVDPAVASGPFITTVTDVTSMLTYFGIAALILI